MAIRITPQNNKKILKYLQEVKNTLLEAYKNKHYPFNQLVKDLNISGRYNKNPLYNVLFVMYDEKLKFHVNDLETEVFLFTNDLPTMDIVAELFENPTEILISFIYNACVISENMINIVRDSFNEIVDAFIKSENKGVDILIGDLEIEKNKTKDQ